MSYAQIPQSELDIFKKIPDVKVVFDVGSRDDSDYVELRPEIELHAFEPNPEFFSGLSQKLKGRPNTYLNNFGLGDREAMMGYSNGRQAFVDGEETGLSHDNTFRIETLDYYVGQHSINKIDFLKIDTEGYDYKVLLGGRETIKKCRFIQYEHWHWVSAQNFHNLLEEDFYMTYIGGRNVFCSRKDENFLFHV